MQFRWLSSCCVQLVVLAVLHTTSAFLITPAENYWFKQRFHFPRAASLPRRQLTPAGLSSLRTVTSARFRPQRQSDAPSIAVQSESDDRVLPPLLRRGRKRDHGVSSRLLTDESFFSPWRGKRSSPFMPKDGQTEAEKHSEEKIVTSRADMSEVQFSNTITSRPVKSNDHKWHTFRGVFPPNSHPKHSLKKRSSSLPNPLFVNQGRSQHHLTDAGFQSSLLRMSNQPLEKNNHQQIENSKNSVLALETGKNMRAHDGKMMQGIAEVNKTSAVDDSKFFPEQSFGRTTSELQGESLVQGLHGEKQQLDLNSKTKTGFDDHDLTSHHKGMMLLMNREAASGLHNDDKMVDLKGNFITDHHWHQQLPAYDEDLTADIPHLQGDFDHPTRIFDDSQPGVGPFFWVDSDSESDSISDQKDSPETNENSFLLNDNLKLEHPLFYADKDTNLTVQLSSNDTKADSIHQHQHMDSYSDTNVPHWTETLGLKQRSGPKSSKSGGVSASSNDIHYVESTNLQENPSEINYPGQDLSSNPKGAKHWRPVFRNQFPPMRRHRLPLSVPRALHAVDDLQTPSPPNLPVHDSPPVSPPQQHQDVPIQRDEENKAPGSLISETLSVQIPSEELSPRLLNSETLSRDLDPDAQNRKTLSKDQSSKKLVGATMDKHLSPNELVSNTLSRVLKPVNNLNLGALPFEDHGSDGSSVLPNMEGAGLMGSHADVVEDTPDGKRVIKYQEFSILSTKGGITLSADNTGHLTITVADFEKDPTNDHNNTLSAEELGKYNDHAAQSQNPHSPVLLISSDLSFSYPNQNDSNNITSNLNQTVHDHNSYVSPNAFQELNPEIDSSDYTATTGLKRESPALTTSHKNKISTFSENINDFSTSQNNTAPDQSHSEFSTSQNNNVMNKENPFHDSSKDLANVLNKHRSLRSKSNDNNINDLRKKNQFHSSKTVRPVSQFRRFWSYRSSPTHSQGQSLQKRHVKEEISLPRISTGEFVHKRRRREADIAGANNTLTTTHMQNEDQSKLIKDLPMTAKTNETRRENKDLPDTRERIVRSETQLAFMTHTQPKQSLHSQLKSGGNLQKQMWNYAKRNFKMHVPFENPGRNKPDEERLISNEGEKNFQGEQSTTEHPRKAKYLQGEDKVQNTVKQKRRFYSYQFPGVHLQTPARQHQNQRAQNQPSSQPYSHLKPYWEWLIPKRPAMTEPYIISNGRTFKPNWFFMKAKNRSTVPTNDGQQTQVQKTRPPLTDSQPSIKPPADTTNTVSVENAVTSAPVETSATKDLNSGSIFPAPGLKDTKAFGDYTNRLIRHLSDLFKISFNLNVMPSSPSPVFQQGIKKSSPRQRRSRKHWMDNGYGTYYLFPLGNMGWVTFRYYKHPPYIPRSGITMAKYKMG